MIVYVGQVSHEQFPEIVLVVGFETMVGGASSSTLRGGGRTATNYRDVFCFCANSYL